MQCTFVCVCILHYSYYFLVVEIYLPFIITLRYYPVMFLFMLIMCIHICYHCSLFLNPLPVSLFVVHRRNEVTATWFKDHDCR